MKNFSTIDSVAYVLVLVGGLNWGLHALGFNLVNLIFGGMPTVEMVIYLLVGLSALYLLLGVTSKLEKK